MPDTTNRPTPESVLWRGCLNVLTGDELVRELAEHGYVIVHPDDVPVDDPETRGWPDRWDAHDHNGGWNACRTHIFGDDQ